MIRRMSTDWARNPLVKPQRAITVAITAPPTEVPTNFEAHMKPLTLPRSQGSRRSSASASVATFWSDAKQLWMKKTHPRSVRVPVAVSSALVEAPSRVAAIISWAKTIQGRRRPSAGSWKESMIGPQKNLKVQGKKHIEMSRPVSC